MKNKILLSVCGIGLGHATRSYAVYKKLNANIKTLAAEPAHSFLLKNNISSELIKGVEYTGKQFSFSVLLTALESLKSGFALRGEHKRITKMISSFKPDIILSDSEPFSLLIGNKLDIPTIVITNLPNTLAELKHIPKKEIHGSFSLQTMIIKRIIKFLKKEEDLILSPTFTHYPEEKEIKFINPIIREFSGMLPKKNFYLVNLGGSSLSKDLFYTLLNALKKFEGKRFVVTANNLVKDRVQTRNITLFPFINNILLYLKECSGVISHAGHSNLSEIMSFKKPSLVFPIKNHIEQFCNAHSLKREGLARVCFSKLTEQKIVNELNNFFEQQEEIKKKLDNIIIESNGAEQVAEYVMKSTKKSSHSSL